MWIRFSFIFVSSYRGGSYEALQLFNYQFISSSLDNFGISQIEIDILLLGLALESIILHSDWFILPSSFFCCLDDRRRGRSCFFRTASPSFMVFLSFKQRIYSCCSLKMDEMASQKQFNRLKMYYILNCFSISSKDYMKVSGCFHQKLILQKLNIFLRLTAKQCRKLKDGGFSVSFDILKTYEAILTTQDFQEYPLRIKKKSNTVPTNPPTQEKQSSTLLKLRVQMVDVLDLVNMICTYWLLLTVLVFALSSCGMVVTNSDLMSVYGMRLTSVSIQYYWISPVITSPLVRLKKQQFWSYRQTCLKSGCAGLTMVLTIGTINVKSPRLLERYLSCVSEMHLEFIVLLQYSIQIEKLAMTSEVILPLTSNQKSKGGHKDMEKLNLQQRLRISWLLLKCWGVQGTRGTTVLLIARKRGVKQFCLSEMSKYDTLGSFRLRPMIPIPNMNSLPSLNLMLRGTGSESIWQLTDPLMI